MTSIQAPTSRFWTVARLRLVAWAGLVATSSSHAAPMLLASQPQNAGGSQPAPNILLTVDDSGSMTSSPDDDDPPKKGKHSRIYYLKKALGDVFLNPDVVPENSIRLGFQALHHCRGFGPGASKPDGTPSCPENRLRRFSGEHREGFKTWVENLEARGGTPSHGALYSVNDFMSKASGVWDPFVPNPGYSATGEKLSCRRSYHIFMTDGSWKDRVDDVDESFPGNADGTSRTLPDGKRFDPYGSTQPETNIYRDSYLPTFTWGSMKSTQADWAFHMWATDYSGIPNNIKPIIRKKGTERYGSVPVSEYWNPRNNPMTWQGITTYTIGFGPVANLPSAGQYRPWWGGDPLKGGDVNNLFKGSVTWGNPLVVKEDPPEGPHTVPKRQELWHMGINGRGQFLPATNEILLTSAFRNIINQVFQDDTDYIARSVSNTQSIRSDSLGLVSSFNPINWSGDLLGYQITSSGALGATPNWSAAKTLDGMAPTSRRVYSFNANSNLPVSFEWDKIGPIRRQYFKASDGDDAGGDRLNFIRGDRSMEGSTLRTRDGVLGDVVNSAPWVVSTPNMGYADDTYIAFRNANINRREMVYVGANDGMLHGFAMGGHEVFSYIPRGSFTGASNGIIALTDPAYAHRYFVDGSPFSGDYQTGSRGSWKTVLIGSMGLGGRGFFAIDITLPGSWGSASADNNILFDKTDSFTPSDPVGDLAPARWEDIGHLVTPAAKAPGNPNRITQVTKLNNDRWAVLLGNGVNSGTEKASLLIQFLDGDRELVKIETDLAVGGGNGLSTPTAVDLNGDRKTDVVYAGDLKGRLWKFDLSSSSPSNWKVSFSGHPLFVARSADGQAQPITTVPSYVNNGHGGINLVFATGRNLTPTDPNNKARQTVYSVWDNTQVVIHRTASGPSLKMHGGTRIPDGPSGGRNSLLQRKVEGVIDSGSRGTFATTDGDSPVNYALTDDPQRGWYFDLPATGERAQENSTVVVKSLVYVPSVQPVANSGSAEETCNYQVKTAHFGLFLDAVTGLPYLQRPLFDTNGDGLLDSRDVAKASRIYVGADPVMLLNTKGKAGEQRFALVPSKPGSTAADGTCNTENCGGYTKAGGAAGQLELGILNNSVGIGWRQLQ